MSLFKFKKQKITSQDNIEEIQNRLAGLIFKGLKALKLPKDLVFVVISSPNGVNNNDIIKSTGIKEKPFIYLHTIKPDRLGKYWGNEVERYSFKVLTVEEVNNL